MTVIDMQTWGRKSPVFPPRPLATADSDATILAWERRVDVILQYWENGIAKTEAESEALYYAEDECNRAIAAIHAKTADGMAAKLRLLLRVVEWDSNAEYCAEAAATLYVDLERLP